MRIVIDLQGAQTESRFRGIGRHALSLALSIARKRGAHEVVIALNALFPQTIKPLRAAFAPLLPPENVRVWYAPGPVREIQQGNQWRRKAAEQLRSAFFQSLNPDVLFITSLFEGYADDAVTAVEKDAPYSVFVKLYDLIPLLSPEKYLDPNPVYELFYRKKLEHLQHAAGYLALSDYSAREGIQNLRLPKERVTTVYSACEPIFRPRSYSATEREEGLARLGIQGEFILYTGGFDERKNLDRLIAAYALLPERLRRRMRLLLAGKIPEGNLHELRRKAASEGVGEHELLCPGYIPDDDLVMLYNLCSLFVLPSLHEGFGLPALEAMNCGAPVIGAKCTAIPEVIGWEKALFDPLDERAISTIIQRALEDADYKNGLIRNAAVQAGKFNWDQSADKAISFFEAEAALHGRIARAAGAPSPDAVAVALAASCGKNLNEHDLEQTAWALCLNHPEPGPTKIFVDVSELCQRDAKSGVQRVTRSILKRLLDSPPEGHLILPVYATVDRTGYLHAAKFTQTFTERLANSAQDLPLDFRAGDIFLGLDLQHHVVHRQKAYLEEMHRAGVRLWFVVYDLLPVLLPLCFLPGTREGHEEWLRTICSFDGALCISRSVADELRHWRNTRMPEGEDFDIGWFHLGADLESSVPSRGMPGDTDEILLQISSGLTILMVGTIEPRKGYAQTLAAVDMLWEEGEEINLVIVGKQGWMTESLCDKISKHKEAGRRLFWIQNGSDEYLEKIYSASTCLLAASEGEGFGLPLIEAARHGLPILARDIPVFREVAGRHAFYFDAYDGASLAQAIKRWRTMYNNGQHPEPGSLTWQHWGKSAEQIIDHILARPCRRQEV